MVALQPDDEHIVGDWSNQDDDNENDNVTVFPSSAPEILIETTVNTSTKKRKSTTGKTLSLLWVFITHIQ